MTASKTRPSFAVSAQRDEIERRLGRLSAELEEEKARCAQAERVATVNERRKIAQALHDSVCQSLGGANLEAAILCRELEKGAKTDGTTLRDMIRQAVKELHAIVQALNEGTGEPTEKAGEAKHED